VHNQSVEYLIRRPEFNWSLLHVNSQYNLSRQTLDFHFHSIFVRGAWYRTTKLGGLLVSAHELELMLHSFFVTS
jgi:hypothetical protein